MGKHIGIDLGTTYSAIAVYIGGETSDIIELEGKARIMPSAIMYKGGKYIVGEEPFKNKLVSSDRVLYSFKKYMGTDKVLKLVGDDGLGHDVELELTPVEASSLVLKALIERAAYLYPDIKDVVITVPAAFKDEARRATNEAGKLAGLNVITNINEPTAASLNYKAKKNEDILVYDLGGGTFDVTLLRVIVENASKNTEMCEDDLNFEMLGVSLDSEEASKQSGATYEILASEGNTHLGGDDLDELILVNAEKRLYKELKKLGVTKNDLLTREERRIIRAKIEQDKRTMLCQIGAMIQYRVQSLDPYFEGEAFLEVTNEDFRKATESIFMKTRLDINKALASPKCNRSSVKKIILVGGSTKNEYLRTLIRQTFPDMEVCCEYNPDESVAMGAAIQSAVAKGESGISVLDVSPYTISVGAIETDYEGREIYGRVTPLLKKNSTLPCVTKRKFSIVGEDEDIKINLYRGDSAFADECVKVTEIIISKDKLEDNSAELEVIVNTQGILTLNIKIGEVKKEVEVCNVLSGDESEKEVLTGKAKIYSKRARKFRAQLELNGVKIGAVMEKHLKKFAETGDKKSLAYITKALKEFDKEITIEQTSVFTGDNKNEVVEQ